MVPSSIQSLPQASIHNMLAQDDWIIGLHYTFQDDQYLYMVMECPVGFHKPTAVCESQPKPVGYLPTALLKAEKVSCTLCSYLPGGDLMTHLMRKDL